MKPPTTEDRIESLVHTWEQERSEHGRELSARELCRDCPELADELERRIRLLRRSEQLVTESRPGHNPGQALTPGSNPLRLDSAIPPLPPGYELLGKAGEGGMGLVYKTRNLTLNRVEALKMVRAGEFAGERELARFHFEAEAAAGLDHPNIVTVYGVGEVAGRPYLALRWVDGASLAERKPHSQREAATLVAKVARAVHFAHERGILHRDLKPANILVDATGEPYVSDFGIARRLDSDNTMTQGGPIGTPAYMSPEQAQGTVNLTVASDVYSLGVVLYELLTGRTPFTGRNHFEVLNQVISTEPASPRSLTPGVDPDLAAICLKCLEKKSVDRYASSAELAAELEAFLHGEAITARPPGLWDWLRQMWRTQPEPNPHYSWPVTAWFGGAALLSNAAIYQLVQAEGSGAAVWGVNAACAVFMFVVLWWYMLRKFRHLPVTERHSLIIAAGHVVVYLALTAAYVPLSFDAPARTALGMFPALTAASGLGLFILGSTNWSRFFPIGLGVIALIPVMAWWPGVAPLIYGSVIAVTMWYWAYSKRFLFGGTPNQS